MGALNAARSVLGGAGSDLLLGGTCKAFVSTPAGGETRARFSAHISCIDYTNRRKLQALRAPSDEIRRANLAQRIGDGVI